MNIPTPGDLYRHYKSTGGSDYTYKIVDVGKHTETEEDMVIYKSLYGDGKIWIRPLYMRNETVTYQENEMKRFMKIEK